MDNENGNRPRNRGDNRVPHGLSFMMWPALVRAPWLIGSFLDDDLRLEVDRRRKRDL
jgi:hypothetical protein